MAQEAFRGLAGRLVTGVSIVVTLADGEPLATTAGSIVAASWEPPLLAVFFHTGSRMDVALAGSGRFTVNLLGEADHGLARRCARPDRGHGWDAFAGIGIERRNPSPPVIASAIAWADCSVVRAIEMGDHRCYVSEILDLGRNGAAGAARLLPGPLPWARAGHGAGGLVIGRYRRSRYRLVGARKTRRSPHM